VHILTNARRRARDRGEVFLLTREWVLERVLTGKCEATKLPFDFLAPPEGASSNPFAPSIDRIDSRGLYTPDNCQVVVWIHNGARKDYGDSAVLRYARAINREATRASSDP
jgi:hypothetical protein